MIKPFLKHLVEGQGFTIKRLVRHPRIGGVEHVQLELHATKRPDVDLQALIRMPENNISLIHQWREQQKRIDITFSGRGNAALHHVNEAYEYLAAQKGKKKA